MSTAMPNVWIQAARPKTLLVSISPVLTAVAVALGEGKNFPILPAVICFVFAVMAQVISNYVNDLADFSKGADDESRVGPRRMLASGLIDAGSMKRALVILTVLTGLLGLSLIHWGGWWLLPVGALVGVGAYSYSTGPWPLSYHGLGDLAVVVFYGIVPVAFTHFVLCGDFGADSWLAGLAMGLVADELLIVNNYRDADQDKVHGKLTTVVLFGKAVARTVFLLNPLGAWGLGFFFVDNPLIWSICGVFLIVCSVSLWSRLGKTEGAALNSLLGKASTLSLLFALMSFLACAL